MVVARRDFHIEWGDCDPAGIVFYPRYFAWFDACTAGLFELAFAMRSIDILRTYDIVGIPTVETHAKFIMPSRFGDVVSVESRVTDIRTSSFNVRHELYRDGALMAEGNETRVWVGVHAEDPDRIQSRPIPQEVITRLMCRA